MTIKQILERMGCVCEALPRLSPEDMRRIVHSMNNTQLQQILEAERVFQEKFHYNAGNNMEKNPEKPFGSATADDAKAFRDFVIAQHSILNSAKAQTLHQEVKEEGPKQQLDNPGNDFPRGWVCPLCGSALSPTTKECPHHTPTPGYPIPNVAPYPNTPWPPSPRPWNPGLPLRQPWWAGPILTCEGPNIQAGDIVWTKDSPFPKIVI